MDKCPNCGSEHSVFLYIFSDVPCGLIFYGGRYAEVRMDNMLACLDCGVLYLPSDIRKKISEAEDNG